MRKLYSRVLPAMVLGGLLAAPLAWSMGHGGPGKMDPERMISRLSEHLSLTEQQESQVRSIMEQNSDQARADRERLQVLREELEQQRSNFDPGQAQKLADELGEISARMAYSFTSKQAQVYEVLSDEQRAEFEQLQAERQSRGARRFGK